MSSTKPRAKKSTSRAVRVRSAGSAEPDTGELLLDAAQKEFAEHGFGGTDTNKIARRAGFAPQTFYRWYRDKSAIFIAVYVRWEEDERAQLEAQLKARGGSRALAQTVVQHHRAHLMFRRSLRQLAVSDPEVRKARAESRLRQAERIRGWTRLDKRKLPELCTTLLEVERLADALAEGELADLQLSDEQGLAALVRAIDRLRG